MDRRWKNEMSEELSEEIPQELPQVSTDIGDLLVEEPIPEEIEAKKELMPEEPAKQEELPSIQIPEDVIEDEDVTMHLTKAQKRDLFLFCSDPGNGAAALSGVDRSETETWKKYELYRGKYHDPGRTGQW